MIKFLFLGRRAAGRTRAAALGHLRDIHGRMVVCPPVGAGAMPAYYAQNHVIDGAYPAGDGPHAIERDLVTHLEFESMAAMRAAVETPYYLDKLRPDEPRFVDDATVARLNMVPSTVLEGRKTLHKLFVLVSRSPTAEGTAWSEAVLHTVGGSAGIVALTDNEVIAAADGTRFVDRVFEAWFENVDDAQSGAVRTIACFGIDGIDDRRSLVIVAEEFTQERLRSLLGC